ncbi:MAG: branched-chain amino acid ABC transporter ATP-binding protein/permease [candidate division NC10 bacterium]|nr:branched-chain amino acid ABC transporter ATP-binding protein/permease [candidate division NC10 bacterium]
MRHGERVVGARWVSAAVVPRATTLGVVVVLLGAVALPHGLPVFYAFLATDVLILALFGLSMNLLLGYSGMVSFGHAAYLGVGGYAAGLLALRAELPMAGALVLGAVAAAVAAMLFGAFAVRLSAVYFAMLTLAFQMILHTIVFKWRTVTGGEDGLRGLRPAALVDGPVAYYYFALGVLVVSALVMYVLLNSPFGYTLRAIRENPVRTAHVGVNVRLNRWLVFVVAGFFAGVAGVVLAFSKGSMFPEFVYWTAAADPILVAVLGGMHSFAGPIVGAVFYRVMVYVVGRYTEYWPLVEGALLILVAISMPRGLVGFAQTLWASAGLRSAGRPAPRPLARASARLVAATPSRATGDVLRLVGLRKHFGDVRAVDGVSLTVEAGQIHAIIGPNGAGKSTLFNLLTGHLQADEGEVYFGGKPIGHLPSHAVISRGIARTFQITSILRGLAVYENVLIAVLAHQRRVLDCVTPAKTLGVDQTWQLLELVGLSEQAGQVAGVLSHGDQKRLELAIALANQPTLLLLDEPTAGMAPQERFESVELVRSIARREGLTVLFTEHDMDVVFSAADRITVMHQGRILAEGAPDDIRKDERVQRVYLGGTL